MLAITAPSVAEVDPIESFDTEVEGDFSSSSPRSQSQSDCADQEAPRTQQSISPTDPWWAPSGSDPWQAPAPLRAQQSMEVDPEALVQSGKVQKTAESALAKATLAAPAVLTGSGTASALGPLPDEDPRAPVCVGHLTRALPTLQENLLGQFLPLVSALATRV